MNYKVKYGHSVLAAAITAATLSMAGCNDLWDDDNDKQKPKVLSSLSGYTDASTCSEGGNLVSAGIDDNDNGTLDTDEITDTIKICNGSLIEQTGSTLLQPTELALGDERCDTGGYEVAVMNGSKVVKTYLVCNTNDNTKTADNLISQVSATPQNPDISQSFTLEVTPARLPKEGETLTTEWVNLDTSKVVATNQNSVKQTAPDTAGDVAYSVTIRSSKGIEETNNIVVSVQDSQDENSTQVSQVNTGNYQISVPDEFAKSTSQPSGDFDGALFFAESGEAQPVAAASLIPTATATSAVTYVPRDMAAFVAERPTLSVGTNAREVLEGFANIIGQQADYKLTNISTGAIGSDRMFTGIYKLATDPSKSVTEAINDLISLLGTNKLGGTVKNLPTKLDSEIDITDYRLFMTVAYQDLGTSELDDDRIVLASALVPNQKADKWENAISRFTSGRNIAPTATVQTPGSNNFSVKGASQLADFLFVIDNSGSMSDNQNALADAADSFINTITSSGLDYAIGTINTGSTIELADTNQDGGFTSNLSEFKEDVINQGTSGSYIETGIYNAEKALLNTTLGDPEDGVVTLEGYPRKGASMSVVILSDEKSQYESGAGYGNTFDAQNNLFTNRGYTVYALVESADSATSQYDDLALATGGTVADIGSDYYANPDFTAFMEEISKNVGGVSSNFTLPDNVDPATIEVRKNGQVVPVSTDGSNGWIYRPISNSVLLRGDAAAEESDSVEIRYLINTSSST